MSGNPAPAADMEPAARLWTSGELFAHYHDWHIERCEETVFDCRSAGIPHRHAVNAVFARKPEEKQER